MGKDTKVVAHDYQARVREFFYKRRYREGHCNTLPIGYPLPSLQPDGSRILVEILGNNRFDPYFKDCIGSIDCTHVCVKLPLVEASRYHGRKSFPTQNVLVACLFDLKFTYVLPGWESTAYDSMILKHAQRRTNGLKIPKGS